MLGQLNKRLKKIILLYIDINIYLYIQITWMMLNIGQKIYLECTAMFVLALSFF